MSSAAFQYLSAYTWGRVIGWLRRKHRRITWKDLRRRYCGGRWWPASEHRALFNPATVRTTRYRYRYRGTVIPTPWPAAGCGHLPAKQTGLVERPVPRAGHAGYGERPAETALPEGRNRAAGRLHHDRVGRTSAKSREEFVALIRSALRRLQRRPHLVRAFFGDPDLAYITA